jgi:predicted phage terminase large subunit-like protein
LEAVSLGQIKNLLINVPPGFTKSLSCCVFWPMWEWGPRDRADTRWMFFSYDQELSTRDSLKCRTLMDSAWYQGHWGDRFALSHDQNQRTLYNTTRGGFRSAGTSGTGATGQHPDRIVVDDAHNPQRLESKAKLKEVISWWTREMPTRGATRDVSRVVDMQRLGQDDLSGHIIANELEDYGYVHLCFPMRFERNHPFISYSRQFDPRTEEGQLIDPNYMSEATVNRIGKPLGEYGRAGQFQQRPSPNEGGFFKVDKFERIARSELPASFDELVRYWDTSQTVTGDPTAGVLGGRCGRKVYIVDVKHEQASPRGVVSSIASTSSEDDRDYGALVQTVIEEDNKYQTAMTTPALKGLRFDTEHPRGSKSQRAESYSIAVENGEVYVVEDEWTDKFIAEHELFPNGTHDDMVDAASGMYRRLMRQSFIRVEPADLEAMAVLDGPWIEDRHPYNAAVGALFCNRTLTDAAFVVMGTDDQRQRIVILHAQRWQRTPDTQRVDVSEIAAHVMTHGKRLRCLGIAYDPTQCDDLAGLLRSVGMITYPFPMDNTNRAKSATTLLAKTRQHLMDLYTDRDLFGELCSLEIKERSSGGYIMEHGDSLPLGTAFAVCLHWSKGTMEKPRFG